MFDWFKILIGTHKRCSKCNRLNLARRFRYKDPITKKYICEYCYRKYFRKPKLSEDLK